MTLTANPLTAPAVPDNDPNSTLPPLDSTSVIDRLRAERDSARADRDRAAAEFESFKVQVSTVGEEAARRHGWCGTYDAILAELGLSRPVRRVTGTITLTLSFTGTPNDIERAMSHRFVRDSLQLPDMELAEWFDNDWDDTDISIDRDMVVISEVTIVEDI